LILMERERERVVGWGVDGSHARGPPLLSHTLTHSHTHTHTQISAALATFGLADTTRHVLVARFVGENDKEGGDDGTAQVVAAVGKAATLLPLDALPTLADPAAQASAYGVGPGEVGPLADAVATRIGVRECG